MKASHKHGLLAAVIIAAVLIITIPMLISKNVFPPLNGETSIKNLPHTNWFSSVAAWWDQMIVKTKHALGFDTTPLPSVAPSKITPVAWVIALHPPKNHEKLSVKVKELQKHGFAAYIATHKKTTVIFVGPETRKYQLKSQMDQVEKLSGLKGEIVPFDPLE